MRKGKEDEAHVCEHGRPNFTSTKNDFINGREKMEIPENALSFMNHCISSNNEVREDEQDKKKPFRLSGGIMDVAYECSLAKP